MIYLCSRRLSRSYRLTCGLLACLGLLLSVSGTASAAPAAAPVPAPAIPWNVSKQGGFVVSLCRDMAGNTWAGTEDQGVWRYSPTTHAWTHFHNDADLGDAHCYALACDRLGRLWCGTATHGVSVFNGKDWRHFGPTDGPLGAHVTALAASPGDGDVWGATEAGVFRYSLSQNTWSYYTHSDGLPSEAANALTFGKDGTLYVGTQCDGIAIASALDDYKAWRIVPDPNPAASAATPKAGAAAPNAGANTTSAGAGLPSALVNCLLVAQDGTVYCGTGHGLAASHDGGQTWRYRRAGKGRGLLSEEYVTALAEDGTGHLWVGHREASPEVFDPKTGQHATLYRLLTPTNHYVAALLPVENAMLVGSYGGGLVAGGGPLPNSSFHVTAAPKQPVTSLPLTAKAPTLAELNTLLAQVGQVKPQTDADKPFVTALDQDWQTKGDWQGRYGRYWACLCALFHPIPLDYIWGASPEPVSYDLSMGPNHGKGDSLRYWMHWRYTQNPNSLELPPTFLHSRVLKGYTTWAVNRRQSEVDDHGEAYPLNAEGPNIYATVSVPDGLYTLSLYDFNKDGHTGTNRYRDYRVSVRAHVGMGMQDNTQFAQQPELAHGRIQNFWNGVWTRFLVHGPQTLTVEINRNNSFNTILPGLMLDKADETPPPYFHTQNAWQALAETQERRRQSLLSEPALVHDKRFTLAQTEADAVNRLFDAMSDTQLTNPSWAAADGQRVYMLLMRWYGAQYNDALPHVGKRLAERYGTCCYQAGQYPQWEAMQRMAGLLPARAIEKSLRWDTMTASYSGMEYEVLTAHLAGKTASRNAGAKEGQPQTNTR